MDGSTFERSIILDGADTAPDPHPDDPSLLHQPQNPRPRRTAAAIIVGSCNKDKLSNLASAFKEVLGTVPECAVTAAAGFTPSSGHS
eukprot:1438975-Pleurochrysis_carterae.AAC.1